MQRRSDFGADAGDTDNHWKVEQEEESNRPEGHPHLETEEEKEQQPNCEKSRGSPVTHRFPRVVRW